MTNAFIFLFFQIPAQQPIVVSEEEDAPQQEHCEQEWSPSVGQDTEIKEEQELGSPCQSEEEQLGLESDNATESIFTSLCTTDDCDQDPSHLSHHYQIQIVEGRERDSPTNSTIEQIKTEPEREGYGVSEESTSDPLQPLCDMMIPDIAVSQSGNSMCFSRTESLRVFDAPPPSRPRSTMRGQRKSFTTTRTVKKHSDDKPHQCDVCEKSFQHMSKLRAHLRVHTGERPYSCPECGKRFSQSGEVNRHLKTHVRHRAYLSLI